MHIITRKRLNEFAENFPETETALARWYRTVKTNNFSNFAELREMFSAVDQVGKLTVFNIGGNKVRLI
jgi:mRNA interferase HigB